MLTLSSDELVKPFAKINLWVTPAAIRVRAYILVEQSLEGAVTGIAIDGSGTMRPWFGAQGGYAQNKVAPLVRNMCIYLVEKLDVRGYTEVIYWATGSDGAGIELVGPISPAEALRYPFPGPKEYGPDTYLAPALRHFINNTMTTAKLAIYLFVTDGRISDLDVVKQVTTDIAQRIENGQHIPVKLVLIGVGTRVDEAQFRELDDLDTGTNQDLWDYKIATRMEQLAEIFTEMVDSNVIVADRGTITCNGMVVKDYRDTGLPALLEFELPPNARSFTLEVNDNAITQALNMPLVSL